MEIKFPFSFIVNVNVKEKKINRRKTNPIGTLIRIERTEKKRTKRTRNS